MKRAIGWLIVVAVLAAGGYFGYRWYESRKSSGATAYRTAPIRRTDIAQIISATGTVVPEDVIDVGAQVNGQIAKFGTDEDGKTVDYRSSVKEGAVLAWIDDALFAADMAAAKAQQASAEALEGTATAQVGQAQAQVKVAEANKEQARAKAEQARRDWERAQRLGNTAALSKADYDAAQSAYEQAIAAVSVADASILNAQAMEAQAHAAEASAKAAIANAAASVQRAQRNLNYCVITSPVSGVIIDRRVEIGQTVVASLNAPSLFLLAKDLTKMEVLVQVNEADIGNVHPGQAVSFTVDAFPARKFKGEVRKVRLNATMTQNVVTYTVEISTDNADLALLPYLTANVKFDVAHRDNVLSAPNAALRWAPKNAPAPAPTKAVEGTMKPGTLWVLKGGVPQPIDVKAGLTDGVMTETESSDVAEGLEVIVGEQTPDQAAAAGTNPFAPQMFRGNRPAGGQGSTSGGGTGGGAGGGGGGRGGGGGGGR
jgi:HlyD family secretion protein